MSHGDIPRARGNAIPRAMGNDVPRAIAICPECGGTLLIDDDRSIIDAASLICSNEYEPAIIHAHLQSDWQPVIEAVSQHLQGGPHD